LDKIALLQKLPPFQGRKKILVQDQSVGDIITGVLQTHKRYQSDYDKIYKQFAGTSIADTAKNVFNFLKQNCRYVIETEDVQTLRSPAAIIATGERAGCDCKSYSLFINGVMDAYRRATGKRFNLVFRFAGYDGGGLQHVFAVIETPGNEIWVDPVLLYFNDRSKTPTKIKDKKIMALVSMAGIPANYRSAGKSVYSWPQGRCGRVCYNGQILQPAKVGAISDLFFEAKRLAQSGIRGEVLAKLDPFADAFLYAYIPTGPFAQNWNARNFFAEYNLPDAVRIKRDNVYPTFLQLQRATGLRETEFWPALRAMYQARYGMSPESFLSQKLGFAPPIADKETVINGMKVGFVAAAVALFGQVKDAATKLFGAAASQIDLAAIAPQESDWQGWVNPKNGKTAKDLFNAITKPSDQPGSGGSGSGRSAIPLIALAAAAFKFLT